MDYPYIEVQARNTDGSRATVIFQLAGGDLPISDADIVAALSERLSAVPGVTGVTATRHHVEQTAL
ncbi:hypothetical protein [Streptomyces neyagawaensis]|uniref:hypothetical protein n=1 Tax=Streptomyces neyagawaensis TaxID=42238 RepID=UPI0006E314AF|nr:hypothetical protein [Streptomyces neyagawaensis]MCL6733282.1 hypothetical protein [Streptomyces neyagawaensis]MDE1685084.1 hypothetical protein [Streptomyces neyagawaensis]